MDQEEITIRSSPFQFIKRFVAIEFIFALLPFILLWLANLLFRTISDTYERFPFADTISLNLFSVIIFTSIQVLIIAFVFIAWYVPVYIISHKEITQHRGFLGSKKLAETRSITDVSVKQGRLAKALDYGTLHISAAHSSDSVKLKDVPEPARQVDKINQFVDQNDTGQQVAPTLQVSELVTGGEHHNVEYKSSFVWDYYQQRANKALHESVMKTIVAFLNSTGGYLLIGVSDDGQILGLEPDLSTLGKQNLDGFETSFNMAFNKMIGVEFRQWIEVAFPMIDNKAICILRVQPSPQPAYLQHKGTEKFYIRAGNASQSLTISQANRYIQRRFN
ncbi:MAG: putative DNA binding domain-containing protein [Candidatus Promineifilaceae bacterium]|nr:putative DNA binding domain-containing protein [Candidatus Promineifilaceae bacterium]